MADVVAIETKLKAKSAALRVMDPAMDTSTPAGRLTFNVLADTVEILHERQRIEPRVAEKLAKATGKPARYWLEKQLEYDLS